MLSPFLIPTSADSTSEMLADQIEAFSQISPNFETNRKIRSPKIARLQEATTADGQRRLATPIQESNESKDLSSMSKE
jgi:hypothetical protein